MSTNFPTSVDNLVDPVVGSKLATNPHSSIEINQNDAIEALEAKVGITGSGVSTSLDYKVVNASSVSPGHKHVVADINDYASNVAALILAATPVGVIWPYGGSAAPTGFVLCDGSSLLRAGTYANLFTVLSTTYGSADGTHFNVPDLRGRIPVGAGTGTGGGASGTGAPTGGSALTAVSRATWKGEETHVLTVPEMPAHTHPQTPASGTGAGNLVGNASASGSVTGSTGGDGAHNNIQPVMGVNFIIKY